MTAGDCATVPLVNRALHRWIDDTAGYPRPLPIVDSRWLLLAALLKRCRYDEDCFDRVIERHQHLSQAIERRDARSVATLMGAHIEKTKNNLFKRAAAATQRPAGAEV